MNRRLTISPERAKKIGSIKKDMTKTYGGEEHLVLASDIPAMRRIPTGCIQLDVLTGGGYPLGGNYLFWGWQSAGKTTTVLKAVGHAQKICAQCDTYMEPQFLLPPEDEKKADKWRERRMTCLHCGSPYHKDDRPPMKAKDYWGKDLPDGIKASDTICDDCGSTDGLVDVEPDEEWARPDGGFTCKCGACEPRVVLWINYEGHFDPEWAEACGVNLDALLVEDPHYGEAGIDIAEEAITAGAVDIVVVDSIAQIATTEELNKSSEKSSVASAAKKVNEFLRGLPSRVAKAKSEHGVKVTTFLVNQVRHTIGGFGNPDTMFGGHGQVFVSSITLKFTSSKADVDEVQVGAKTRKEFIGVTESVEVRVQCDKNRTANTQDRKATFRLMTSNDGDGILNKGDVDDYDLTYKYGRATKIIENNTDWEVKGWPITYANAGDLKLDIHNRPHLRRHLHYMISREIVDNWAKVKKHL